MLSMVTHRKTLVKGHDPRNAAISIILSILITTFLLASLFLYVGVEENRTEVALGIKTIHQEHTALRTELPTSTAPSSTKQKRFESSNTSITSATGEKKIEVKSSRSVGYLLMSAVLLLASIPPVLAFVGIKNHSPKLLIPMIVLVYTFSAFVHVGSIVAFVCLLFKNEHEVVTLIVVCLLGLCANLVFFFIGAINHCAFYHTYIFLKEPIRVSERVDIEETPIVSKFSQNH